MADITAHTPRVSLGLPVYNGENFLAETLASIAAQSFEDFELIISDNASTDGTEAICRDFAARDPRVRYIRQPVNLGAAANYDTVFHASKAPLFKWCAHDDLIGPEFLAACVARLEAHPEDVGALPKDVRCIDADGQFLRHRTFDFGPDTDSPGDRFAYFIRRSHSYHCAPFFSLYRRAALETSQLHGDYLSSDRILVGEMLLHGRLAFIDGGSFSFRIHDAQFSQRMREGEDFSIAWIDPAQADTATRKFTRYCREAVRAVGRAQLPLQERQRAYRGIWALAWDVRLRLAKELCLPLYRNGKTTRAGQAIKRLVVGRRA